MMVPFLKRINEMEIKKITCPFCHTESNHGVKICLSCKAHIGYGLVPQWFILIGGILAFLLGAVAAFFNGLVGFFIAFGLVMGLTVLAGKSIYSERVVFQHRI